MLLNKLTYSTLVLLTFGCSPSNQDVNDNSSFKRDEELARQALEKTEQAEVELQELSKSRSDELVGELENQAIFETVKAEKALLDAAKRREEDAEAQLIQSAKAKINKIKNSS